MPQAARNIDVSAASATPAMPSCSTCAPNITASAPGASCSPEQIGSHQRRNQ